MYQVYIDGACEPVNPGGTASYGLLVKRNGVAVFTKAGIAGRGKGMSNNVAEYSGLLAFLGWYEENGKGEKTVIHSDSRLLINQMKGSWKVRKGLYLAYCQKAARMVSAHGWDGNLEFRWIPREQNTEADRLSKVSLKNTDSPIQPSR